jgi:hypothetical protein
MKSFCLCVIVCLCVLPSLYAQENAATQRENKFAPKEAYSFLTVGVNVLDNGGTKLPLDSKNFGFKKPFFLTFERRISSRFSGALSFSMNKLELEKMEKEYYSIDASALYYFDEDIFNNSNIETYVGLGLGRQFWGKDLENTTFNGMIGGRYWFSKKIAVSLEAMGKLGSKNDAGDLLNTYKYNLGIVWNMGIYRKPKAQNLDLENDKVLDKIADKVADKIIKKMYANEKKKDSIQQAVTGFIRDTTDQKAKTIVEVSPEFIKSLQEYVGDWYISIKEKDGKHLIDHVQYAITTSADNDGTLWISDDKKGWWMQCKIKLNPKTGTFSATAEPNVYDKGTITITDGKIQKNAALSKSGHAVDKISFKAEFSYDQGHILIFEGHKRTGLEQDNY